MTKTYTFSNVAGLHKALRRLPKDATVRLRSASLRIAARVAERAGARARMVGGVSKYVAPTIKPKRDRVPKIVMGGAARLPARDGATRSGRRQTVGDVMWGAEFGSDRFRQFSPWRGSDTGAGYFLWPTVRAESDATIEEYGDALIDAVDKSAKGAR